MASIKTHDFSHVLFILKITTLKAQYLDNILAVCIHQIKLTPCFRFFANFLLGGFVDFALLLRSA